VHSFNEIIEYAREHGSISVLKAGTKRFIFRNEKEILLSLSLEDPLPEIQPLHRISIRKATLEDVEELSKYWWRSKKQLYEWIKRGYPFFLAIEGDKIIGYTSISLELPERDPIFIEAINKAVGLRDDDVWGTGAFVHPAYRGRNIYPALGVEVMKYTRQAGYRRVLATLSSNNSSSRIANKKIGYKEIREITFFRILFFRRTRIRSLNHNDQYGSDYWNRVANRMNRPIFQSQIALYKKREYLDLISTWSPSPQGKSMLKTDLFEEAFGKDSLLDVLGTSYATTVGIDISQVVTEKARRRLPRYPLLVANVYSLPFKEESFDTIISTSTLDHFPFRDLPGVVNELWYVLKPGGCLILTLDSKHNLLHRLFDWIRRGTRDLHGEHSYTVQEIMNTLKEGRFQITNITSIYHIFYPINLFAKILHKAMGPRVERLIQSLIDICHKIGQLPTRYLTGGFIAVRAIKPRHL